MKKKIKFEYIVLVLLAVALVFYLIFRNRDRILYKLPELPEISVEDLDTLQIDRDDTTIEIVKSTSEIWRIMPKEYRVDPNSMEEMLDAITGLTVSDLVSVSGSYGRYGLDQDSRITVQSFGKDELKRKLYVGRTADSYSHTFIMLEGNDRVYYAEGNLKDIFDDSEEELRDKLVLSFNKEVISEVSIRMDENSIRLIKATVPINIEEGEKSGTNGDNQEKQDNDNPADTPATKIIWKSVQGESRDTEEVNDLLARLSNLRCTGFAEEGCDLSEEYLSLVLTGDREYSLSIFQKSGDDYFGLSSGSESVFILPSYQVDRITDFFKIED